MKPQVLEKILAKRLELTEILNRELENRDVITLEIGCGHGHFLVEYGQLNPGQFFVGIDVHKGRIFKALKKGARAGLNNVLFLNCESLEFLSLLPSHVSVSDTWILYPDPWPKKRHFKNRIIQGPFLEKLASLTASGGRIFIRSDYEPFIEWSTDLVEESNQWTALEDYQWPNLPTTVFQELTNNRHHSLVAALDPAE